MVLGARAGAKHGLANPAAPWEEVLGVLAEENRLWGWSRAKGGFYRQQTPARAQQPRRRGTHQPAAASWGCSSGAEQ